MKRRAGRIYISNKLIEKIPVKILSEITKDLFVVRSEQSYIRDAIEYIALSDKFEEVETMCELPEYEMLVMDNDGVYSVEYKRHLPGVMKSIDG